MRRLELGLLSFTAVIAAPLAGQELWLLTTDRRIDIEDGPAEPVGELRDFVVGADGRVFVLDDKSQVMQVFSAAGRFERTVSPAGAAPGEMRATNGLILSPDGTSWANDPGNNRLAVFGKDGTFLRTISHNGRGRLWGLRSGEDSTSAEFDLFNSSGVFLGAAEFRARLNVSGRMLARGDALCALVPDDDDLRTIKRARLTPVRR